METKQRKSQALNLVNQVRTRAGLSPLSQITQETLYQELKHEFALEGKARPIMIRFGHWEDEWNWKYISPDKPGQAYVRGVHKRWFPIPEPALNVNAKLVQNTGY